MPISNKKIELYKKLFGEKLKEIRKSKDMSQFDLASTINDLTHNSKLEKTTISRIENGRTNITLSTAIKLSFALEVELKELFDFKIDE